MADFLALDWESQRLSVVEAQATRGAVRIRNTAQFAWPESLTERPASDVGQWLKTQLAESGISARHALLTVPREETVVRQLALPDAPLEELPDLVRFQAQTKSTVSLDEFLLDFVPLPKRDGAEGLEVLMATVGIQKVNRIREIMASAGLDPVFVGLSPFAAAELVAHEDRARRHDPAELSLLVCRHGERIEISMVKDQRLVFAHSAAVHGETELENLRLIVAEISRARFSAQRSLDNIEIRRVWILGSETTSVGLAEAIRRQMDTDVQVLDPLTAHGVAGRLPDEDGQRGVYAGPIGALLVQSEGLVPQLNFLDPRKRPEQRDTRRIKVLAVAGGVIVTIAAIYSGFTAYLNSWDDELDAMRTDLAQVEKRLRDNQPTLAAAEQIGVWHRSSPFWPQELADISHALTQVNAPAPGADVTRDSHRVFLTQLNLSTTAASSGVLAHVSGDGFARTGLDVSRMREALVDRKFRVHPSEVKWSKRDSTYIREFQLDLDSGDKPQPEQATRRRLPRPGIR